VKESIVTEEKSPVKEDVSSALKEVLRMGTQKLLQAVIENEVTEYLDRYSRITDEKRYRLAVRNGYLPERDIITGLGPVSVLQPRIDDRKLRHHGRGSFTACILPRYLRRVSSIDNLILV